MSGERAKDGHGRKIELGDVVEGEHSWIILDPTPGPNGKVDARSLPVDGPSVRCPIIPRLVTITHRGGHSIGDPRDKDGKVVDVGMRLMRYNNIYSVTALLEGRVEVLNDSGMRYVLRHDSLAHEYSVAPPKIKTTITVVHNPNRDPAAVIRGAGMEVE